jgi:hypothetical protein
MTTGDESEQTGTERQFRFLPLLVTLLLIFAGSAFVHRTIGRVVLAGAMTGVLLSALFALRRHRDLSIVAAVITIPGLAFVWIGAFTTLGQDLAVARATVLLVFFAYMTVCVLSLVFHATRVTSDTIAGAIAAYLLVGLTFAFCYQLINIIDPGAFRGVTDAAGFNGLTGSFDSYYYSFVTLTTLGFGDISPIARPAQVFTTLEALTGQLYLAVLIARLVGLQLSSSQSATR